MVHNHNLAKSILDASWNKLIQYTSYKAEDAGRKVVLVNPANTSQMCSNCGQIVKKDLSIRVHNFKTFSDWGYSLWQKPRCPPIHWREWSHRPYVFSI